MVRYLLPRHAQRRRRSDHPRAVSRFLRGGAGGAAPDAFVFLGDNVYGDTTSMDELRAKYRKLDAIPEFKRFRARFPVTGTWDDHDFGVNDGGEEYPRRRESQELHLDFFRVPRDSPRRSQEGVYSVSYFGAGDRRIQLILLDMRYFRDPLKPDGHGKYTPDADPAKTFLGAAQWDWLREQLAQPAVLRLLGSSIQMLSEEHPHEKWMNFPHERQRLFDAIRAIGATGVVTVSGDRHFGELARFDGSGVGYPLYEMTTSSLTHTSPGSIDEANRHRIEGSGVGVNNFGLVSVDWEANGGPEGKLGLKGVDGRTLKAARFALADLG
jgi:alkaline phosphatase D